MNHLEEWEAQSIINNIKFVDKNEREMKRMELFVSIQSNSRKKLNVEEIFSLPWDEEGKNRGTLISKEEQQKLRARAAELAGRIQTVTKMEKANMGSYITKVD